MKPVVYPIKSCVDDLYDKIIPFVNKKIAPECNVIFILASCYTQIITQFKLHTVFMKKISLLLGVIISVTSIMAQTRQFKNESFPVNQQPHRTTALNNSGSRNLACQDTLRYPELKHIVVLPPNSQYATFDLWNQYGDGVSQTFLQTGGSVNITGVEFLCREQPGGITTATVRASIYNVNASNIPTTLIGSGTLTVSDTNYAYRIIQLTSPVTVTGNYAVVFDVTNTNGRVDFYLNSATGSQVIDEGLSKYKSTAYASSNGAWVSIPVLLAANVDAEAICAPIVNYSIQTNFTVNPNPVCLGNAVAINNTTTPTALLNSRFYTWGTFLNYFLVPYTQDSIYAWDMDDTSPIIWNTNNSYTYAAAGTYDATMFTLGGLWNNCTDFLTIPVTVNPVGNATFAYTSNTVCSGSSNPIPTTSSAGTFSSTPAGLTFVSTSTGEIDMAASNDGSYSVTFTTSGPCPQTTTQTFTITSAPSADFSYASAAYCINGSDPSVVLDPGASNGVYSGTTGLVINASTGVIDLSASTAGAHTITNTIAASGACPAATATFDITVNAVPSVSFAPTSACSYSAPITLSATPAGGSFSGTGVTGNQFNPSAGTQTVTYTYTDANNCTNSANALITVNLAPTATFAADTACSAGSPVTLTATPAGGVFSGTGVTGNQFNPASGTQTLTYIYTDANSCVDTATAVITVNTTPSVSWTAPGTLCVYNAAITLAGGTPAGGSYSGTGVSGGQFDPATAGTGTHPVTYSFTQSGCTGTSTGNIVVSACLGIEELTEGFTIYPNPSNGFITLDFGDNKEVNFQLVTTTGQIVYNKIINGSETVVDLSSLAKAVYYAHVTINNKTYTSKLILN